MPVRLLKWRKLLHESSLENAASGSILYMDEINLKVNASDSNRQAQPDLVKTSQRGLVHGDRVKVCGSKADLLEISQPSVFCSSRVYFDYTHVCSLSRSTIKFYLARQRHLLLWGTMNY